MYQFSAVLAVLVIMLLAGNGAILLSNDLDRVDHDQLVQRGHVGERGSIRGALGEAASGYMGGLAGLLQRPHGAADRSKAQAAFLKASRHAEIRLLRQRGHSAAAKSAQLAKMGKGGKWEREWRAKAKRNVHGGVRSNVEASAKSHVKHATRVKANVTHLTFVAKNRTMRARKKRVAKRVTLDGGDGELKEGDLDSLFGTVDGAGTKDDVEKQSVADAQRFHHELKSSKQVAVLRGAHHAYIAYLTELLAVYVTKGKAPSVAFVERFMPLIKRWNVVLLQALHIGLVDKAAATGAALTTVEDSVLGCLNRTQAVVTFWSMYTLGLLENGITPTLAMPTSALAITAAAVAQCNDAKAQPPTTLVVAPLSATAGATPMEHVVYELLAWLDATNRTLETGLSSLAHEHAESEATAATMRSEARKKSAAENTPTAAASTAVVPKEYRVLPGRLLRSGEHARALIAAATVLGDAIPLDIAVRAEAALEALLGLSPHGTASQLPGAALRNWARFALLSPLERFLFCRDEIHTFEWLQFAAPEDVLNTAIVEISDASKASPEGGSTAPYAYFKDLSIEEIQRVHYEFDETGDPEFIRYAEEFTLPMEGCHGRLATTAADGYRPLRVARYPTFDRLLASSEGAAKHWQLSKKGREEERKEYQGTLLSKEKAKKKTRNRKAAAAEIELRQRQIRRKKAVMEKKQRELDALVEATKE